MGSTRCDADASWVPEKASLTKRRLTGRAGITADLNRGGNVFLVTWTLSQRPWSQSLVLLTMWSHLPHPLPAMAKPVPFSASRGSVASVASVALSEPVGKAGMGRSLLLETPRGWQRKDGGNMKEETMNSFLPCFDNGRALWID